MATAALVRSEAAQDRALARLLARLSDHGYVFVTPTPGTHALVRDRSPAGAQDRMRDIFGWTRPFAADLPDPELLDLMRAADILEDHPLGLRSTVRVSSVEGRLYLHSAPSDDRDAVFLGPDSYRYARFLRQALGDQPVFRLALDIGVGAGVGALTLKDAAPSAAITGCDVNPRALRYARLNADHAGVDIDLVQADGLPRSNQVFDLIATNPPYIAGNLGRTYRDGGDHLGAALALGWVGEAMARVAPGGRILLYTGSAIVCGEDFVRAELGRMADRRGFALDYDEIDPDVFGATLRQPAYRDAERIAVITAILTAP